MPSITSTGLGSGLDINSLVGQLVAAERQPATNRLDRQEAQIQAKISAFGSFKSALSDFRTSLSALSQSSIQKLSATSSDDAVLSVAAESNADLANYRMEVKQLAQSHSLASRTFTAADEAVGTGTLTFKFGATDYDADTDSYNGFTQNADKGTLTLTIDASNNTLTGIRDAINRAEAGVTAAVVNDGTGYRLVLNSQSGSRSSLEITVADSTDGDDSNATGLSALAFNAGATQMIQTQAAQDAIVSINGLDVLSQNNAVSSALKGVTLNLQQAQPGKAIDVAISQDSNGITQAVEGFISSYNALVKSVDAMTGYDADSQTGGVLLGDPTVRGGMMQIRAALTGAIKGLDGSVRTLADLGIRTQGDGTLGLDSDQLNQALESERDSVAALFTVLGRPSDGKVRYLDSSEATQAGDYAVNISQAATRGILSGGDITSLTIDQDNDTFKIKVDGVLSDTIALTQKTYASQEALAAEIQSRINGDSVLKEKGLSVSVGVDEANGRFVLTSQSYGAASQVEITQVDAMTQATLGLAVGTGTAGMDVAGTVGGATAQGEGQVLTVTGGAAQDLKLLILNDTAGDLGSVKFTRGLIERLDQVLGGMLDSKGALSSLTEGLQKRVEKIEGARDRLDERVAQLEKRLFARFNAMDSLLGRLQLTSNFLGQQLATLPFNNLNKDKAS